jgi:hypothetical protein
VQFFVRGLLLSKFATLRDAHTLWTVVWAPSRKLATLLFQWLKAKIQFNNHPQVLWHSYDHSLSWNLHLLQPVTKSRSGHLKISIQTCVAVSFYRSGAGLSHSYLIRSIRCSWNSCNAITIHSNARNNRDLLSEKKGKQVPRHVTFSVSLSCAARCRPAIIQQITYSKLLAKLCSGDT